VYDVTKIADAGFLNNIKNSLNGLHFGFGIPNEQIKIVAALHGPANLLNFDDFIWNKYQIGAWLKVTDPSMGQSAVKNVFYPSKAGHLCTTAQRARTVANRSIKTRASRRCSGGE
jgi:hypothetical protein